MDGSRYGFMSNVESKISFEIDGECSVVVDQCDFFNGFGDGNKYFAILASMDSVGVKIDGQPIIKGLWIYPACGGSLANGDLTNLLNDNTIDTTSQSLYKSSIDIVLSDGNISNWYNWPDDLNLNWPINVEIINDYIKESVQVIWINGNRTKSCEFNETFSSHQNLSYTIINDGAETNLLEESLKVFSIGINTSYSQSKSIFECMGEKECQHQLLNCTDNADCSINCNGTYACDTAMIICPRNAECNILCIGQQACRRIAINGNNTIGYDLNNGSCIITSQTNIIGVESEQNLFHTKIHAENAKELIVNVSGTMTHPVNNYQNNG